MKTSAPLGESPRPIPHGFQDRAQKVTNLISHTRVKYRRIPILSIGRDIYCDTRLILRKLESLFPSGALSASSPSEKALEQLLEQWTVDGGVFTRCGQLIPPDIPLIKDPQFKKDREDYAGRSWQESDIIEQRPEALAAARGFFGFLEEGLLADGREWIGGTKAPSMADIHCEFLILIWL